MKKNVLLICLSLFCFSCSYIPDTAVSVVIKPEQTEMNGDSTEVLKEQTNTDENTETGNEQEKEVPAEESQFQSSETEDENGNAENSGNEQEEQNFQPEKVEQDLQPDNIPEKEPEMVDIDNESQVVMKDRQWSILLYMCGDNNLESAAIEDILEIEASKIDTDEVSIFALVDRHQGYNTSNDNWTGTRLYRLKTGIEKNSNSILSERIECPNLGLKTDMSTELDMSSNYVLSGAMSYVMERFPADHYGLIVWGHGTGWRGEVENHIPEDFAWKGFAYDETSGSYMTLHQFGEGLKKCLFNKSLDFIGFDTCYGGEIEIMYEIKDFAKYAIGSEGLVASSGWNYEKLFNYFYEYDILSPENFCNAAVRQFKESYKDYTRSAIAVINLEAINDYVFAFNNYCAAVADKITSLDVHDKIMGVLYDNEACNTEKYTYGKPGYDIYLDVNSIVENLQNYFVSIKSSTDLIDLYSIFKNSLSTVYKNTWASDRTEAGLGVYFSTLTQGSYLSSTHPAAYISGKTYNQILFVNDCTGYVPASKNGNGLLDKLFYTQFN